MGGTQSAVIAYGWHWYDHLPVLIVWGLAIGAVILHQKLGSWPIFILGIALVGLEGLFSIPTLSLLVAWGIASLVMPKPASSRQTDIPLWTPTASNDELP